MELVLFLVVDAITSVAAGIAMHSMAGGVAIFFGFITYMAARS
jgi:hypothetical protein